MDLLPGFIVLFLFLIGFTIVFSFFKFKTQKIVLIGFWVFTLCDLVCSGYYYGIEILQPCQGGWGCFPFISYLLFLSCALYGIATLVITILFVIKYEIKN